MKGLILVGGPGLRLRPLTEDIPKPMLPIDGKPFVEYRINWLKKHGVTDIVLLTGYKAEKFKEYFGDGSQFGVNITYSNEDEPLGTGGAIKKGAQGCEDTFVVLNGDVLFAIDLGNFIEFHKQQGANISIALAPVEDTSRFGLVDIDENGKVKQFYEKGEHPLGIDTINGGVYLIEASCLKHWPEGKFSIEQDVFPHCEKLYAKSFDTYFVDIGTPESLSQFEKDFHDVVKL